MIRMRSRFTRVMLLAVVFFIFPIFFTTSEGQAKNKFPQKPITLICPWSPGGGSDQLARALQPGLSDALGVPVSVINVTGGGGVMGWTKLANSPADGHTMSIGTSSMIINKLMNPKTGVSYQDYTWLSQAVETPLQLIVAPDSQWNSVNDIITYGKANPEKIKFGIAGVGTQWHIGGIGFAMKSGIDIKFVPYKGGAEVMPAIMGKHIDGGCAIVGGSYNYVAGGKLKSLAMFADKRHPDLPDVPTLKENGVDFEWAAWIGVITHKDVSPDIAKILDDAIKAATETEQFKNWSMNSHFDIKYKPSNEFYDMMAGQATEIEGILRKAEVIE